ncbi:NmrA family NAD(P)-binding protein [Mucilaginibacter sp.]|uniref:NmrA family NAD(P)-binding protein n=1 Tax=Mucilaginibacter sp. TaxID=1882438 RepID=UPI002623FFF0|nr:NmrA family NAD(P)-binding protein [Mucilaginibacter sp.]MDB5029997.1 NmrA family protein [Mucilaginibacter sp.]
MKITLTGSIGNIGKPLTESLVKAGHQVTVITSKQAHAAQIKSMGAIPAVGSIEDVAFLTNAFTGADVVYAMVPPNFGATHWKEYIAGIGHNYAAAIKAAGVTKVVQLSSIGAHLTEGAGPITGLHQVEVELNKLEGVVVKYVRAGFFYTNFYSNVDMIKHAGLLGSNYGADTYLPLVHPVDVADAIAEEIQQPFTANSIRYAISDEHTAGESAAILGKEIGKPELPWVEFTDADTLGGMLQAGLPEEIAKNYVEMGEVSRNGKMQEDFLTHRSALGKRKLEDFAVEFAKSF